MENISDFIATPVLIIASAFFVAISITWMIFPFLVIKRLDKISAGIAEMNKGDGKEKKSAPFFLNRRD